MAFKVAVKASAKDSKSSKTRKNRIPKEERPKHLLRGRIRFENDAYHVYITYDYDNKMKNKLVKVAWQSLDCSTAKLVYVLPTNDTYPAWTPYNRNLKSKINHPEIYHKFWGKYLLNMMVHGYVNKDELFIVTTEVGK